MVLELRRPAEWAPLAALWQGVQADLGWPAPAIAVNGLDGYQLWFSLQTAVEAAQAESVLKALCARYLPDVAPHRLRLLPHTDTVVPESGQLAFTMPGEPVQPDQWSAFVAPDLAPVFADTPWLDVQPGLEGQAELLSRLHSIPADAFLHPAIVTSNTVSQQPAEARAHAVQTGDGGAPRRFLLEVMNDTSVAMALRIEAAKALLLHEQPRRHG